MIPALFLMDFHVEPRLFLEPANAGSLLSWDWGPPALCFVTWNFAVRVLGSIKTSVYIYMVPVVTTVTSALILKEKITAVSAVGILLTLGASSCHRNGERKRETAPLQRKKSGRPVRVYEKCRYGIERKM